MQQAYERTFGRPVTAEMISEVAKRIDYRFGEHSLLLVAQ